MSSLMKRYFVLACWSLLLAGALTAQSALEAELTTALQERIEALEIPGATLSVVLPDGQLISMAAGWADAEAQTPMQPHDRMLSGSVGKVFVSAVALQLAGEGKLDLNAKVSDYLGEEPWYARIPNAEALTVRSLMNHTTGIPRYVFTKAFLEELQTNPYRSWTPLDCLTFIFDERPTHPVGQGWGYSDTNYIILGMILEKLTGNTYYEELQTRILDPLELHHTSPSVDPEMEGLVQGHTGKQNYFNLPPRLIADGKYAINPQFEWTGGGLVTNTDDLAVMLYRLHRGDVLNADIYINLIQPVDPRSGQAAALGYGLGTFVWGSDLGVFYGHSGMMPGYLTQVEFSQKKGYTVAFQMNSDESPKKGLHILIQEFCAIVEQHLEH